MYCYLAILNVCSLALVVVNRERLVRVTRSLCPSPRCRRGVIRLRLAGTRQSCPCQSHSAPWAGWAGSAFDCVAPPS